MPNGKTHTIANILPIVVGTATTIYFFNENWMTVAIPLGSLLGLIVTPDLDIERGSISNKIVRAFTGSKIIERLWWLYWYPYAKIAKHRGLSHYPIFSTLVRFVYLFWWAVFLPAQYWQFLTFAFIGLVLSDLLHITLDAFF